MSNSSEVLEIWSPAGCQAGLAAGLVGPFRTWLASLLYIGVFYQIVRNRLGLESKAGQRSQEKPCQGLRATKWRQSA
jgi:hypothetical protein